MYKKLIPTVLLALCFFAVSVLAEDARTAVPPDGDAGKLKISLPSLPQDVKASISITTVDESNNWEHPSVEDMVATVKAGKYQYFVVTVAFEKEKKVYKVSWKAPVGYEVRKGSAMELKVDANAKYVPVISQKDGKLMVGFSMPDTLFPLYYVELRVNNAPKPEIMPSVKITMANDDKKVIAEGRQMMAGGVLRDYSCSIPADLKTGSRLKVTVSWSLGEFLGELKGSDVYTLK